MLFLKSTVFVWRNAVCPRFGAISRTYGGKNTQMKEKRKSGERETQKKENSKTKSNEKTECDREREGNLFGVARNIVGIVV